MRLRVRRALSVPIGSTHTGDDDAANAGKDGDALVRNDSKLLSCRSDLTFGLTGALAMVVVVVTLSSASRGVKTAVECGTQVSRCLGVRCCAERAGVEVAQMLRWLGHDKAGDGRPLQRNRSRSCVYKLHLQQLDASSAGSAQLPPSTSHKRTHRGTPAHWRAPCWRIFTVPAARAAIPAAWTAVPTAVPPASRVTVAITGTAVPTAFAVPVAASLPYLALAAGLTLALLHVWLVVILGLHHEHSGVILSEAQ